MKGTVWCFIRFVSCVTVLATLLLFCHVYAETYNDERFEVYSNMNTKRDGVLYIVPNLYRQDAAYKYVKTFPVVVSGGIEYVPISMFSLYSYITVTYSKINNNFYMTNTKTGQYLSFDVTQDVAETTDGKTIEMKTRIYYRTRYIPAREVAKHMGVICETYDDQQRGIFAFRIRDNNASYTFQELLKQYLPSSHFSNSETDNFHPDKNQENPDNKVDGEKDPVLSVAQRQVAVMFEVNDAEYVDKTLKAVTDYGMQASFAVDRKFILSKPGVVRKMKTKAQTLAVSLSEEEHLGVLTSSKPLEKLVDYLDGANEALNVVCNKKARVCVVPDDIVQLLGGQKSSQEALSEKGYMMFCSNVEVNNKRGAYSMYSQLSDEIVKAYPKEIKGLVKMIIPVSDKSEYIATNLAKYINKYPNFTSISANETMA